MIIADFQICHSKQWQKKFSRHIFFQREHFASQHPWHERNEATYNELLGRGTFRPQVGVIALCSAHLLHCISALGCCSHYWYLHNRGHWKAHNIHLLNTVKYPSAVLSTKNWTINPQIYTMLYYRIGLAKSWTHRQSELLSGKPLSGLPCSITACMESCSTYPTLPGHEF